MAVYKDELPSMHLSGDDLKELEDAIESNSTNASFLITIHKDGFKYNLDSVDPIIEDFDIPDKTTEYSINLDCEEGSIRIGSSGILSGRIRISGDKDWVQQKRIDLEPLIQKNRKILRTHIEKVIFGLYGLQWAWFFIQDLMGRGESSVELSLLQATFGLVLLFILFVWPFILLKGVNFVYPEHLLKRDESVKYRPRLRQSVRIGLILLSVIGGIGGAATLVSMV